MARLGASPGWQGTAAVTVAGIIGAIKLKSPQARPLDLQDYKKGFPVVVIVAALGLAAAAAAMAALLVA